MNHLVCVDFLYFTLVKQAKWSLFIFYSSNRPNVKTENTSRLGVNELTFWIMTSFFDLWVIVHDNEPFFSENRHFLSYDVINLAICYVFCVFGIMTSFLMLVFGFMTSLPLLVYTAFVTIRPMNHKLWRHQLCLFFMTSF